MNAAAYIGKPWRALGRGPEAFDCWGLLRDASRALYGTTLPGWAEVVAARKDWRELAQPSPGCAVVLLDMHGRPYHVGLYVGSGQVLHTSAPLGARVEPLRVMSMHAAGLRFYAWER